MNNSGEQEVSITRYQTEGQPPTDHWLDKLFKKRKKNIMKMKVFVYLFPNVLKKYAL